MANKLLSNLSGGINTQTSPLIIRDSESELILNYHLDTVGALTKRKGYSTYASQAVSGKTCNGLYQFVDTSSDKDTQLAVFNVANDATSTIFYNSSGTWTNSKTGLTASKKTRFFTFLDYVFYVNGADVVGSSVDPSASWGTTNAPATITPNFGAVFQDRCYVANGGASTASRFWFSSLPSSGAITWTTASDFVDVNPDDGDEITALENNGNRLLIFKNRALYRWTFGATEPDRLIGVGSSSQECVKTNLDLGITFFANQNGVYGYTGGRPKLLSRKIQKFVNAVSDWTNVFGEVDNDHYYLAVGNITVDGRTHSNAMFVYHISLDAWTIYTTATPVKWMAKLMPTSPVEDIYFGDNTGRTYKFLDGTSDNATAINGEFLSKEVLLTFPELTDVLMVDVLASQRVGSSAYYQIDREGQFKALGTLTDRVSSFPVGNKEGRTIRVKLTDNSTNTSIFEGFNIEHQPKAKREQKW